MKKKGMVKFVVVACIMVCIMMAVSTTASAQRTWKKITKLPDGKYSIDRGYYDNKPWHKEYIELKIKDNKFTLNCAVEKSKGRVYCSNPLKLKISKKCKYYIEGPMGAKKVSKKSFLSELKYINENKVMYDCLRYFKVKGNKVYYIYMWCYD